MGKSLFRWQFSIANCNNHYQEGKSHVYQRIIPPFIWYFPMIFPWFSEFYWWSSRGAWLRPMWLAVSANLPDPKPGRFLSGPGRYLDNLSWFMLYLAICLCCRYPYHHIYDSCHSDLCPTKPHIPMLSTDRDEHEGHGLLRHQVRQTWRGGGSMGKTWENMGKTWLNDGKTWLNDGKTW